MSFRPAVFPVLETARLVLREFRESDFDAFCSIYADETNARYIGGRKTRFACWEKMTALIGHWQMRGFGRFAIEEKATGAFLGHCGPSQTGFWPEPEINYSLVPSASGRGVASEAVTRVLRHVYQDLGWNSAVSLIEPENLASRRVAEKAGARCEATATREDGALVEIWRHTDPAQHMRASA
ncbi:MAG TPA: GNAT family N-acetyltransferase [Rhizobiaceae bacterium]|nr:GNAT family N-acetyltransferase [Rhizobiaceae bacterium]